MTTQTDLIPKEKRADMRAAMISLKDIARFRANVKSGPPDQCWEWCGTKDGKGYGLFRFGGRRGVSIGAHRLAFTLMTGPVPPDLCVCHRCDNPPCCNPLHLWQGTKGDNLLDMAAKHRSQHGERNFNSKLTESDVLAIRSQYDGKWGSITRLAKHWNVATATISTIVNRKAWKRVTQKEFP